jgi:hypothetical protein
LPSEVIGNVFVSKSYAMNSYYSKCCHKFHQRFPVLLGILRAEGLVKEFYSMGSVLGVKNRRRWIILAE